MSDTWRWLEPEEGAFLTCTRCKRAGEVVYQSAFVEGDARIAYYLCAECLIDYRGISPEELTQEAALDQTIVERLKH